ncbi:MAG: DUF2939 domain-containing protein [Desulfobaccales bacterium]
MRRSPLIFVLVALLLGLLVAGIFYFRYRNSPRFALHQMVTAITNRNYNIFHEHVDLPAILGHLTEETGKELLAPEAPEGNLWSQLVPKLGGKVARQLAPRLFETFDKELRKLINQYLDTLTSQDFLALQSAVALAEIYQQGEKAQVTLRFPKGDGSLALTMAWNSSLRRWRVVAVNYQDLKQLLKKELF